MPERPLLLFPRRIPELRQKGRGFGPKPEIPSHERQIERIGPQLTELQDSFRTLQREVNDPEITVVFEVIGSIENFLRLCENTEGFEFLNEFEDEELQDEDFGESEGGRLYVSLSRQAGIEQLLNLWEQFQKNENTRFPRGMAEWRTIFKQLKTIRRWGIQDRFEETGIKEAWQKDLQMDNEPLVSELELFYRENPDMRQSVSDEVRNLCHSLEGSVLDEKVFSQISYHGMLIQLPRHRVEQILDNPYVNLVQCEQIMFFRPAGQSIKSTDEGSEIEEETEDTRESFNLKNPRVALLDGFPLQNHFYIRDRILVEDPDGLGTDYPAAERKHGTSMASLIINGDLNTNESYKPDSFLYVRPIMHFDGNRESVPKNRLLIDLIHQAVREIKQNPETEDIRLINLCICDQFRPFYYSLSSIAKMLDWLSWQYNVLFIVSAGNFTEDLVFPKENGGPLSNLNEHELQEKAVTEIYKNQRFKRLLAPAESINALTIGGINTDNSDNPPGRHLELFYDNNLPAPYNPITFGFKKSVKPDLIEQGGRCLYMEHGSTPESTTLGLIDQPARTPGLKVAYPSNSVNYSEKGVGHTMGTSNAAALTSRNAIKIMEALDELNAPNLGIDSIDERFYPVLSKCLLVHSTSWGCPTQMLETILKNHGVQGQKVKKEIQKFLGYGKPNISTAIECLKNRATIIGYDTLENSEGGIYEFPIPACINNTRVPRKLIITVAWISPINVSHKDYRKCHLELTPQNLNHFFPSNKRNTEVHTQNVVKGTVDHRVYEINQPREPINYSEETLKVKVSCRQDAAALDETIRYAVAVTFEENSGADLPVYEEIREHIQQAVRIQGS